MKRLILLVLVIAAGVVVAAFTVPAAALSVDGATVSQSQLSAQLQSVSSSPSFQCLLGAEEAVSTGGTSAGFTTAGAGTGTYSTTFVDYWISQLVTQHVVAKLVAERGLHVAPAARAAARDDVLGSYEETLTEVESSEYECTNDPASFVASLPTELVRPQEQLEALDEVLLSGHPTGVSAAQIDRYYAEHTSSFDTLCVSGIFVSSESTATTVRDQIESGTSFAAAAAANSEDTTTAPKGGVLGCFSPTSSGYASIKQDLGSTAIGTPTQPIESSSGYILLQLTSKKVSALSSIRSAVRAAFLEAGTSRVNTVIRDATKKATITLDPRYGRWTSSSASEGVLPPLSPSAGSVLNSSANLAAPSVSSGPSASSASSG